MATQTTPRAAVLRSRDFMGRDVLDASSNKLGSIRDLLLDRRTGTVRFIEVDLGVFRKQVIIPVGRVDWGEDAFILRGWKAEQVQRLPSYDADRPLTEEMLDELVRAYPRFYGEEDAVPPPSSDDHSILPLKEAKDFRVKKDDADLRGWNVFGSDGERLGKVTELLVDPAAMRIAYLDVDLFEDLFSLKDDRHVLVPAEAVDVRERGRDVWVRNLTTAEVARLPAYTGGPADPMVLARVSEAFGRKEREGGTPSEEEAIIVHPSDADPRPAADPPDRVVQHPVDE